MRLTEIYINGFGIFHDVRISDLSPGLSVFLGDNETGKSTLLGFFRAMMLGFPDGRSNENPYPPIAGGRHGGAMTVVTDGGETFVVERRPGPRGGKVDILTPERSRDDGALLHSLLGPASNRALFKSIYAFSLAELQNFESLNRSAVREALYSAAGGVDPGVLGRLKGLLSREEGDLFKAGAKKPRINTIIARLVDIRKEKRSLSNPTEGYDRIQAQIADLRDRIKDLEQEKEEKAFEQKQTDRWLQLWPLWTRLSAAREKLLRLDSIEQFPESGLRRFEELRRRLADLEEELLNKKDNLKRQEDRLSLLDPNAEMLEQTASIQQLRRDQGHYDAVVREMVSLDQELSDAAHAMQQDLKRLGHSWNEEKVSAFDLSIAVGEEVRRFRERLQQAQSDTDRKRAALEGLRSRKRDTKQALNHLPGPGEEDGAQLQRMKESCRQLRGLLSEQSIVQSDLRHLTGRLNDIRREREYFRKGQETGFGGARNWPLAVILLLGAGGLVWQFLRQDLQGTLGFGAFFLVLLIFVVFLVRARRKESPRGADRSDLLDGREEDLESQIRRKEGESQGLAAQAEDMAAALHLQEGFTLGSVERVEEELRERIHTAERRREIGTDLEHMEQRISEALKELEAVETAREGIQAEWASWLRDRDLDPGLSTEGALDVLSLLALCREQAEKSNQIREKIAKLKRIGDGYCELTNRVLTACGREPVKPDQVPVTVHQLIREFSEAEQSEKERSLLLEEIASSRMSVERLARQVSRLQGELQALILSGGADSEETFRRRAQIFEERSALLEDVERQEEGIREMTGSLGSLNTVLETLSGMELEGLERNHFSLKKALAAIEESLDGAKREEARLEEQVRILLNDEPLSALREEEETLKQELEPLVEEWSKLRLAQGLIRLARARYEKERQPEVIRRAGRFFRDLTLGKYTLLVAPMGEDRIEVVSREQVQKEIGELSRGTAEQLYLSLRFGFIREFCRNSEALPIVMDEILVNFDASRARAAIKGILDLSRDHQILFFTCHPWIAETFLEEGPNTPILEIRDRGITNWAGTGPELEV